MQARRSTSFNITLLADRILLPFLSGDTPDKPEYDYRLIEVSFPLHPNVHLTYIPCFPCPQKMPNYPWAITPTPWNFMQTAVIPLTFIYPNLHEEGSDAGRFSDHPKSEKPASPTKAGELPIAFSIRHFTNITISFSITQIYDI